MDKSHRHSPPIILIALIIAAAMWEFWFAIEMASDIFF